MRHLSRRGMLQAAVVMCMAGLGGAHAQTKGLHEAVDRNDLAALRRLIASGAPLNERDAQGRTPLLLATQNNRVDAARLLIEAGADVNAKDAISDSAYLLSGARGYNEILQLTLTHGADLKSVNRYGGTALIPACERGHVQTVRLLIAAGVDANHINRLGWTCLLEAVILGDGGARHQAIVGQLIAAKADLNLADAQGVTALQHARQKGQSAVATLLQEAGAR